MSLESDILLKIIPTEEEKNRIDGIAERLVNLIGTYLSEHGIDAELKLCGSYSKGTYLANPDLDLFMMFPPGTPRKELEKIGLGIGDELLHGARMYAEHPYTSAVFEGVDVDLVPNIKIESTDKLETAVDRTPFHTDYVLSHLEPGQNDQIRLLKRFMKGVGTYGAEPNVRGFSGYMCELLVLKYGTFENVLRAASTKWKEGMQLSLEKDHSKLEGALVFYDPVDGRRNVASAVHPDTLGRFILASQDYLAHPSEIFFFPPRKAPMAEDKLQNMADSGLFRLVSVSFRKPDSVDDNLYSQLWKTEYALQAQLERFGFEPLRAAHTLTGDRMEIAYMLSSDILPPSVKRVGPPVSVKSSENFLQKWKGTAVTEPFIENGKWCAIVPRQYTSAKEMIEREFSTAGIGKEIDISTLEVKDHDRTVAEEDRALLSDLLDPAPFWKK